MKTIEEKAKAYDEAIKKAESLYKASEPMSGCNVIIETLFPEIKESEDEKIRKEIINYFKCQTRDEPSRKDIHNKWISWLEKQEGCEYIKKDWLEHIKQSWYKEGFIDGKYSGGTSKEWTINDAATLKELIDFLENGTAKLQHDLTRYANWLKNQFTPIEKQGEKEKDILEDAILDGYILDDDEDGLIAETIRYKKEKQSEQKPTDKVEQRFKVKYADSEYNVLEVKDIAGVTFYGIEDEPNHIDYVKAENCKIIRVMTFTTVRKPTGAR